MTSPAAHPQGLARRILRRVLWTVAGLVTCVLVLLVGAFLFARSSWGQQKILGWVLPVVQRSLSGSLHVGHLRSDLLHAIALTDIDLNDSEEQLAVHLDRVSLHYDLAGLFRRSLTVHQVQLSGARVQARLLRDGRINLAALVKPSPDPSPPSTGPLPLLIRLQDIDVQGGLLYRGSAPPLLEAAADLRLRAAVDITRDRRILVQIADLQLPTTQPLRSAISLRGGVDIALQTATADQAPIIQLKDVQLTLNTDGEQVNRVVPAAGLLPGTLALQLALGGDLSQLSSQLNLTLPKGQAELRATLGVLDAALPWQAALTLRGVELRSLRSDLPPVRMDLDLQGQGEAASGGLQIRRLFLQAAHNTVELHGSMQAPKSPAIWQDPLAAQADLDLRIQAPRLDELHATHALLPALAGSLSGAVRIGLQQRSLQVVSKLNGRALRGFGASIEALQTDIDLRDLAGHARIELHDARHGAERLAHATLVATGNRTDIDLQSTLQAHVAGNDIAATLALHALPTYGQDSQISDVALALRELAIRRGQDHLTLLQPTRVLLRDLRGTPVIETTPLVAKPTVALAERTRSGLHIGLGPLHIGLGGRYEPSSGQLRGRLEIEGIDAQHLAFMALGRTDVPRTQLAAQLQVAGTIHKPTGSAHIGGTVDPLPGVVPWQSPVQITADLRGDTSNPNASLSIAVPAWHHEALQGDGATLQAQYIDHVLRARIQAPSITTEVPPIGRVVLGADVSLHWQDRQLAVDTDVTWADAPWLHAKASTQLTQHEALQKGAALLPSLPISAAIDMPSFPLPAGLPATGRLALQAQVSGTVQKPTATATLQGTDLQMSTWRIGTVQARAALHDGGTRRVQLQASIDPAVQPTAAALDLSSPPVARAGAVALQADVPLPFSLSNPALRMSLFAKDYQLNYESPGTSKSALRRARGTLAADLHVQGASPQPVANGSLRLSQGEVAATTLPQVLRDILLDVQLDKEGRITLRDLSANAGSGRLHSQGRVQITGGQLREIELSAQAQKFPVSAGAYSVWLDTQVDLRGQSDGQTLRTIIQIPSGLVQVPKLSASQDVQALGPLADVEFVDAAGRRARDLALAQEQAERNEQRARPSVPLLPPHTHVTVDMPGPFVINGPEVKTDLQGHVEADLQSEGQTQGDPIIQGDLHALNGWLEILGRRYQIDRAQVSLSGDVPPNPLLDISISRKVEDATIYILVTGTAKKPVISFRSDPPTYDQGQIIAMVLSGSSRGGGSIQQQALGALSSLVVGKLKDQLGAAVPVDVIKFDVGGSDAMGANQSSIEIGKYLRDNLYLSYTHRFGNPSTILRRMNNDQVALEWWFMRNYQLHIMGGDQGVGALNLYWYKRF